MCSIFGYVARGDRRGCLKTLRAIVAANMPRGPHAFGFAWLDRDGRLRSYRQRGRFADHLGLLSVARDATMLVGHLRYATHGDAGDNINNHPHPCDGGWLVHNGIVHNHADLVEEHGLLPSSDCDSEVLAMLVELGGGPFDRRVASAVRQTRGPLATLGLWSRPGRLVMARRGNPLHAAMVTEGLYLASLADGLPGNVRAIDDDTVTIFRRTAAGEVVGSRRTIRRARGVADEAPLYRIHAGTGYRGG